MNTSLDPNQLEALQKLFNLGINRSITMLNYLSEYPIRLQMSAIEILSIRELFNKLFLSFGTSQIAAMELNFHGEFEGMAQIIFSEEAAVNLVEVLADEERRKLDKNQVKMQTLSEVGNIIFNGIMGAISEILEQGITYMAPSYREGTLEQLFNPKNVTELSTALFGKTQIQIQPFKVTEDIIIFFKLENLATLLADLEHEND